MAARPSKSSYYGKKKYNFKDSRNQLQPDMKGFLCTCNYGEKDCQKEAINLLREYSEEKDKSSEDISSTVEESTDIMDSLDTELESLSKKDNADWKKFNPSVTGVGNCIFISTTVEDPCDLMYKILEDIERTKVQKTKFLLRMLPILITCKANLISIKSVCTNLLSKYFSTEPTTFAIMFNHRYNNSVRRDEVIKELANQVVSFGQHTVDLSGGAKMTIIVEVVKSVCCLSVVRDYGRFCKFNLLSVCGRPEKRTADGENGDGEKTSSPKVKKQEENDQVKENREEENTKSKPEEEVNETSEL
ncbi:THUMP domain-containing protein 1 [Rhopalosiphum maidis]|uniref:THUMP domain-containing protein 1 n=1 Tax=Rhopalosiphum maidis TaxID=43146 RepID=UPI000F0022FA|nr:THUMP domain-containing protein 1 [Rhopalosiphum maidis]